MPATLTKEEEAAAVAEAVKAKEVREEAEMRMKILGESANQARTFVGDAVDMAFQKKERQNQENTIIAKFLSGVKNRDHSKMQEAYADEEKYLKRKTMNTDKDLKQRAMGAATAGDELVPEIWTNQLIENIERLGLARNPPPGVPKGHAT